MDGGRGVARTSGEISVLFEYFRQFPTIVEMSMQLVHRFLNNWDGTEGDRGQQEKSLA